MKKFLFTFTCTLFGIVFVFYMVFIFKKLGGGGFLFFLGLWGIFYIFLILACSHLSSLTFIF